MIKSPSEPCESARTIVLTHLDKQNTYVRMLVIDFSLAFSAIIPSKPVSKSADIGLETSICSWIFNF